MVYCRNCNTPIDDRAAVCPYCGAPQAAKPVQEGSGFGWGLLGFFVPVAGLVLFIVFKNTRPKRAKSAGIGALISVILEVLAVIAYYVIIFLVYGLIIFSAR